MIKAIKVTLENKPRNPKYLKFSNVGNILIYKEANFPDVWGTVNWRKESFKNVDVSFHEEAGFFPVITPPLNPDGTEKLGAIFEDTPNKLFTYPVELLSSQELEDLEDAKAGDEETTRTSDGEDMAKEIFKDLRKLKNDGTLTPTKFIAAQDLMFDALLPMTYGLWDVTDDRLTNIPDPGDATLLNILNQIRQRITDYINNN